jgi:hypothetical protein
MSKGWESSIRVQENYLGFGSTIGSLVRMGNFLYVDSESIARNPTIRERDNKLVPTRLVPAETMGLDQYAPGGQVTWQPRSDDSLSMLMAFFQTATHMFGGTTPALNATGTWQFAFVPKSLLWTGKQYYGTGNGYGTGTSVYCVNADLCFGQGMTTTPNGIRFERGIVTKLTIQQDPAADLQFVADMKFLQHEDQATYTSAFSFLPGAAGSLSSKKQFVDWNGTLTVGGNSYNIEKLSLEADNQNVDRRKLGQKGFANFPFGRAIVNGQFDLELEDLTLFTPAASGGTLQCTWRTSDGDWLQVFCPNIYYKNPDPKVNDAGPIILTVPFRAYPSAQGRNDAVLVNVCPLGSYALAGTAVPQLIWN